MIANAGHFKQIKNGAFVEAGLNIGLSLILINFLGITGLAIGTCAAMLFRTIQLAIYCSKNIISRSPLMIIKRILVNSSASVILIALSKPIDFDVRNFIDFLIYAVIIGIIAVVIFAFVNFIFFKSDFKVLFSKTKNIIRK